MRACVREFVCVCVYVRVHTPTHTHTQRMRDAELALSSSTGAGCCVGVDSGSLTLEACSISAINGTSVGVTGEAARVQIDQVRQLYRYCSIGTRVELQCRHACGTLV